MKQKKKIAAAETSNQTLNSVNNITLDLISNNIEVEMLILCIFSDTDSLYPQQIVYRFY
jgi:hypothetical protein